MIKLRASKLSVKEVSSLEEKQFLNENHLQGYIPSKVCYGLFNEDNLIELMSFGEPRYNKHYSWELLRLCTRKDFQVYGGASKLFNHFLNESDIGFGVLSYCNRDVFNGKVYEELGFVSNGITKGYHYEKDGKKFHRSNFTKAKCLKLWKDVDPKLSERKIMQLKGFTRVEDKVGQELFVYGDKAKMYIYKLTFEDGCTYVGQHISYRENDDYVTSSVYAQNHKIVKREILLYVKDRATLDLLETIAIADDKCFNRNVNGNLGNYVFKIYNIGCKRNYTWSEETRRKFRETMIGHETSTETRKKISEANKGRKRTAEQRERISESHKGKKLSEESKKKRSETLKRLVKEGKHKCFEKGHEMSEETRKKISEKMKGRKPNFNAKGLKWFNNGEKSVRAVTCPDGFVPGRLFKIS